MTSFESFEVPNTFLAAIFVQFGALHPILTAGFLSQSNIASVSLNAPSSFLVLSSSHPTNIQEKDAINATSPDFFLPLYLNTIGS
jgi:hypothetical protein